MRSLVKLQYMLAGVAAARECGVATYTAEQVIPSTAIMDGLTPPVVVGDASNLLSPPVLDLGGVWWIRYQPLDDSERGDLSWENPGGQAVRTRGIRGAHDLCRRIEQLFDTAG